MDCYLQPLLQTKGANILKDSFELTKLLKQQELSIGHLNNIWLVSLDVESLYPNINLEILYTKVLQDYPTLKLLATFIFENNYFEYNNSVYHQTSGIAMGTNCAVSIANLYLATLLDPIISKHTPHVKFFKRYIDDIFLIWQGSLIMLTQFITYLNTIIPGIKLTAKYSQHSVEFLDLQLQIVNNKVLYSVYQKPLNKYAYITPLSCHPITTLKGFIKGEVTRYKRLSYLHSDFLKIIKLFKLRLINRGYKLSFINNALLRKYPKNINKHQVLPLVIRYSRRAILSSINKLISKNQFLLRKWLPQSKIITAYSKSNNILRILNSSKLSSKHKEILQNTPTLTPFNTA